MPQMRAAAGATGLSAEHSIAGILVLLDLSLVRRLIETRPSRSRIELGRRIKQGFPTTNTVVRSRILGFPVLASKGRLCSRLASHAVLFGRQLLFPLGLAFCDFLCHEVMLPNRKITLPTTTLVITSIRCSAAGKVANDKSRLAPVC